MTVKISKQPLTPNRIYPEVEVRKYYCDICSTKIKWVGPRHFVQCCMCKRDICSTHRAYDFDFSQKTYCKDCWEGTQHEEQNT